LIVKVNWAVPLEFMRVPCVNIKCPTWVSTEIAVGGQTTTSIIATTSF